MLIGLTMKKMEKKLNPLNPEVEENAASRGSKISLRRCVVTGESFPRDELLRFLAAPDGTIVFDVKRNLPGRGVWISPSKSKLAQAIAKKAFARGAKQQVTVPDDLEQKVGTALKQRMFNLLQRALQSREMSNGFEKVASALRAEEVRLLIHANDASQGEARKLNNLAAESVKILYPASREEMAQVLGIANPVHLCMKAGGLAKAFAQSYENWAGFMEKDALYQAQK